MPSIKCRKCYFTVALDHWTNASLLAYQGTIQRCHGLVNLHRDEKRGLLSGNQLSRVYFQGNKSKCLNIFRTALVYLMLELPINERLKNPSMIIMNPSEIRSVSK